MVENKACERGFFLKSAKKILKAYRNKLKNITFAMHLTIKTKLYLILIYGQFEEQYTNHIF